MSSVHVRSLLRSHSGTTHWINLTDNSAVERRFGQKLEFVSISVQRNRIGKQAFWILNIHFLDHLMKP